jgi:hypothetical protein
VPGWMFINNFLARVELLLGFTRGYGYGVELLVITQVIYALDRWLSSCLDSAVHVLVLNRTIRDIFIGEGI